MISTQQNSRRQRALNDRRTRRGLCALLAAAGLLFSLSACLPDGDSAPHSMAKRITSHQELIGGPTALGEVGDYLLANDKIRVIIEDVGFASGSGLFGGSLIDMDRLRETSDPDEFGGDGQDTFGEFFPAFFLEMVDPEEVVVLNDGADGEAAIVEVRGRGGEFVTMLRFINQAMINAYEPDLSGIMEGKPASSDGDPLVSFSVRYILEPGASHVRVESALTNQSGQELQFPNEDILGLLKLFLDADLDNFSVPAGSVLGFGQLNSLFLPGVGYDLRWGLEDSYRTPIDLPALPGLVTDFIASSNTHGTNYGFIAGDSPDRNFVHNKPDVYGVDNTHEMLVLFYAAGFSGAFTHDLPAKLPDGESFVFTNYLIAGNGDVASILDEVYTIREVETQTVRGQVFDEISGAPVPKNVSVLVYQARDDVADPSDGCLVEGEGFDQKAPAILSQAYTSAEGYFRFELPPGSYCARTRDEGRALSEFEAFEINGGPAYLELEATSPAHLQVMLQDESGNPIPGKIMLVATHEYRPELEKRHYLYDLPSGEPWRVSDMVPDEADDPSTRQYLEAVAYAGADGIARIDARPNTYDIYASRGLEYELVRLKDVELKPGKSTTRAATLERVVNTDGYLSGDFHMHARGSIDSGLSYDDRVLSVAAEGLETVVASDHNHVSDYMPYIFRQELDPWLRSVTGVELTTFEFGHFNAFPIDYDIGSINRGAVPWQNLPPQQIFDSLRDIGSISPEETVIQINHPRDTIMGYFTQYNVDPFSSEASLKFQEASGSDKLIATASTSTGPAFYRECKKGDSCRGSDAYETTFSWDFDAIEVYGSKRMDLLHHYRIPYSAQLGGEEGWPEDVAEEMIAAVCTDEYKNNLKDFCKVKDENDDPRFPSSQCEHPLPGYELADWCPFGPEELFERYPQDTIMCDGDEVAFPGGLDDWYNTLNYPRSFIRGDDTPEPDEPVYKRYTATGNSDSHSAGIPEFNQPGSPRNFFYVGYNDVREFQPKDLVGAMMNQRNIVSNGPFALMEIDGATIGDELRTDKSTVDIKVVIRAAKWVGADRFRIMQNGEAVAIDTDDTPTIYEFELDENGEFTTTVSLEIDQDSWFVLEVYGDNSLFPVYTPREVPTVNFEAAIGSIGASFGFGGEVEGLSPPDTFQLKPFAFTNPIWVIHEPSGPSDRDFIPPAPPLKSCVDNKLQVSPMVAGEQGFGGAPKLKAIPDRLDAVQLPRKLSQKPEPSPLDRQPGEYRDLRTLFNNWHAH